MMRSSSRLAFVLTALAFVSGCQMQQGSTQRTYSTNSQPQMTVEALGVASFQASEFDRDREFGGMSAVIGHIQRCYARMSRPTVSQLGLRQCLVFDWFAYRFNQEVNHQRPGFGDLPFLRQQAVTARVGQYGPLAGFSDPEVLGGYLVQGSDTIFSVMANRNRFLPQSRY